MIEIHTLAWRIDQAVSENDDDPASSTLFCRVFIDGFEIPGVLRTRTLHSGTDFTETEVTLLGEVKMVTHNRESWAALPDQEQI